MILQCVLCYLVVATDYRLMIFTHMCELHLSSNKLALLPAAVGSLTHLTILDLRLVVMVTNSNREYGYIVSYML